MKTLMVFRACGGGSGNPQQYNSMIAKRSFQLWVFFALRVLALVIIFPVKVLLKDKLASAKSFQ